MWNMDIWSVIFGLVGTGLACISIFLPHMGVNMPQPVAWAGFSVGVLFIILAFVIGKWGHGNIPVVLVIIFIISFAVMIGSFSGIISAIKPKTTSQLSSRVLVSIQPIQSIGGYLTLKMTFSNDSDKQCIIESIHIMTLATPALIEINKTPDGSLDNNYNNMFAGKGMMSIVKYPFLQPKPNLPKVLTPHELWLYEVKEPFDLYKWLKSYELENIKRIPIALSIGWIDFTGASKMVSLPFNSEITIIEDGKVHKSEGKYQRTELLLD